MNVAFCLEDKEHEKNKVKGKRKTSPEVQFEKLLKYNIMRYLEFKFIRELSSVKTK